MPIILTPPNTLPEFVSTYIKNNKITKTYIIGENDVVSDSIANSFPNSERIYGSNRYDTNIAVLNKFKNDLDFSNIYLASGENFPDALAGSSLATKNSTCVLLLNDYVGQSTKNFLFNILSSIKNMKILGGNGIIPDNLIDKVIYPNNNEMLNLPKDVLTVRQGDWIYYSASSKESATLSKCKIDGTSKMQLSDKYASNITVLGDWIYFTDLKDSQSNNLYRIKIDGTDETQLSNRNCRWFKVVNNKIYSSSLHSFNTMDMDGSNKINIPVNGMIIDPDIVGDYFYYIEQSDSETPKLKIYKLKTDGSSKTQISSEGSHGIDALKVYDNWLYFTAQTDNAHISHLKKMKLDGTEKTNIVDSTESSFDISEDWIYYFTPEPSCLSKVKIDGSEKSKIEDIKGFLPVVKDGWIYYDAIFDGDAFQHKVRIDGTDDTIL